MESGIYYNLFFVDEEPYCVWELDIKERNLEYLKSLDHYFFEYIADLYSKELSGENKQRASIALRTAYHHGLETFFALLCASIQAPYSIYAWMLKYKTLQLRNLVDKIKYMNNKVFNVYGWDHLSFDKISEKIHSYSVIDAKEKEEIISLFSVLWLRFSADFLSQNNINEYNSIKHGFRTSAGGFGIAGAVEKVAGVPAPKESMVSLGYSEFGSSFFTTQILGNPKKNPNFRGQRCSLNWNPESMSESLQLISMSINNIITYLRIINSDNSNDFAYSFPKEKGFFGKPWAKTPGVISSTFEIVLEENQIKPFTKKTIKEQLLRNK